MPHILVTNDDGYQAPALPAMVRALRRVGRVTVFAPDHNWSAAGHTKTMHKPLRINEGEMPDGTPLYVTTGTPSDCVSLALLGVIPEPPDLVISGINHGANLGQDVTYSGTVAGAMEGTVAGLSAIAASQDYADDRHGDLDFAAEVLAMLAEQVLIHCLPPACLLNVNFPACPAVEVRGIRLTRLGRRIYRDVLIKRLDPRGRPYYWIGGEMPDGEARPGTDIAAMQDGYISITPLNLDMTDDRELLDLAAWELQPPVENSAAHGGADT